MGKSARQKAMRLLRTAGDILEEEGEELILPGWDKGNESEPGRCAGIREAARAVAAEGLTCDGCTRVPLEKLGFLVRYVGDMLEE